jgi:uncharacterized protein (TIGR02687 family)
MNEITQALSRLFERHRIVFWYDAKRELKAEYDAVSLPDVEKVIIGSNQFGLKYRILRQEPKQKFLLYHYGPQPDDLDNWLLDVQLAHGEFRADQAGLWLHELGLPVEFTDIMAAHTEFFKAAPRRAALKSLLQKDDTHNQIKLKMLAVCAGTEPRLDAILEHLLAELATSKDDKIRLIQRCELEPFLWQRVEFEYGYRSETAGIRDFAITLFKDVYALSLAEQASLNNNAVVFLKRWKDSVRHREFFGTLSAEYADILGIEQDLAARDYQQLIDRKILSELAQGAANRTISSDTCTRIIHQRQQTVWFNEYAHLYAAIEKGAQFLHQLELITLSPQTAADALQQYSQTWFVVDQLYRQFIYHARQAGQKTLLQQLLDKVNRYYTNKFLLPLNDQWQELVNQMTTWHLPVLPRQADFYEDWVTPFLDKDKKVFVIISDALRYEIGDELARRMRQEDRYEANLNAAVTLLPSFTQLGMAALLPHQTLAIASDGKTVLVDGQNSAGTESRRTILAQATNGRGTAVQAEEFLRLNREESRALFRDHVVVYIYHNRIDATGDKRDTEERVFDAAAETIEELIKIIKKLAGANATNMLVTADHGFIYQHTPLDESDFAGQQEGGDEIVTRNRRFVLGRGLVEGDSFKKFTAADVGLDGDLEILLPKSINRLRVKGAGSRYVHGGASLQEIIVPVLQINKKRQSDVSQVEVDVMRGASTVITTNQVTIRFYQTAPVTDKVQPRMLRVGLYTQAGKLISDQRDLVFDFSSENEIEREIKVQFILTREADEANGKEIVLRLEEKIAGTSHYQLYKSERYTLRRSFTSDFDF